MDCYSCVHRREVPGSTHSACGLVGDEMDRFKVAAIYMQGRRIVAEYNGTKTPLVELNSHGVKNGWCLWPVDFDPVWVDSCLGYSKNESKEVISS
jgi:hypothetical protein